MLFNFFMFLCTVAAVYGRSVAEIRLSFVNLGLECSKEHNISTEEMVQLNQFIVPDSPNVKCLLACVFRKNEFFDDKGMFDIQHALSIVEKEHLDDNKMVEISKKMLEACKEVNESPVSDGEKGCDRAMMLTKCLILNTQKFKLI